MKGLLIGLGVVAAGLVGYGIYEHVKGAGRMTVSLTSGSPSTYAVKKGTVLVPSSAAIGGNLTNGLVQSSDNSVLTANSDATFTASAAGVASLSYADGNGTLYASTITVS